MISEILVKRETIEKEEFDALLAGQVRGRGLRRRGEHAAVRAARPARALAPASSATPRRPLPRPGLAGGTAEMRARDPERPEPPEQLRSGRRGPSRLQPRSGGSAPERRTGDVGAHHGRAQRHARLVLGRRALPRSAQARRARARAGLRRGARSSTWAASPRGPGAEPVGAAEELRRVLPVIEGLAAAGATTGAPAGGAIVSIDTQKSAVAREALRRRSEPRERRERAARRPATWPRSSPRAVRSAVSCTCSASLARCNASRATRTSWTR